MHGVKVGILRNKCIRKGYGIRCKKVKKFKATTKFKHTLLVAENFPEQNFEVEAPNRGWLTDIRNMLTSESWL
ncbi:hypothetical protein DESUT3_28760 [Desulfuromonas versatilis]|uniref:Transposase n=1 Tax=Desulfuromonas versatilis TaxID=2802975 RepID=A0ABM8HU08_9BACT|nr:hypothetical protein DESUT3_28760 [Desulfuromonas versatilis]